MLTIEELSKIYQYSKCLILIINRKYTEIHWKHILKEFLKVKLAIAYKYSCRNTLIVKGQKKLTLE